MIKKEKRLIEMHEAGFTNKNIAKEFDCCAATVSRAKKRLGINDSEARKRAGRKPKIK